MKTVETFYKPGLEPVDELLDKLATPNRLIHAKGLRFSVVWRLIVILLAAIGFGYLSFICLMGFIHTAAIWNWCIIIVLCPICLIYIPWVLISSFRKRVKSFRFYKNIYENGVGARGEINTLTYISGSNHHYSHVESKRTSSKGKVRVDYTFEFGNNLKTGTVFLRESSTEYLYINKKICVIYLPDNPSKNMLFPMPGNEFFEYRSVFES